MPKKVQLLLVQGGVSGEHDVSIASGKMILSNLDKEKYNCRLATIKKNGIWLLENNVFSPVGALHKIQRLKIEVAFIALHGAFGEDGKIQALFEAIGLPYTGSGPEASMLAMNKAVSNLLFKHLALEVPSFIHVTDGKSELSGLRFPAVIKPNHGGSSIHISFVNSARHARVASRKILDSGDTAIVQTAIKGREFTCGILEDTHGVPIALPPTEIIPIKGFFFDFKAKYTPGGGREITPPAISATLIKKIQTASLKAHTGLGCSGMSRSDFIFDGKKLYILEINTIPGMTQTSLLPQEANAAGVSFSEMLDRIILNALNRHRGILTA